MPHDESGAAFDLAAVPPGIRAIASGKRAQPQRSNALASFNFQIAQQADPPGQWAGDVWEQTNHFRGVVALAIRPYLTALHGAKFLVFRKRKTPVRKSLAGAGAYTRDDEFEPVDDHPLCRLLESPSGEDGVWTMGHEAAFLAMQRLLTGTGYAWMPTNADGKPVRFFALTTALTYAAYGPGVNEEYPQGAYRVQPYSGFGTVIGNSLVQGMALLPAEEVGKFKDPNPWSRQFGLSRLDSGAREIDIFEAINQFRWTYFNEGVALDTIVTMPGANKDTIDNVREQLLKSHAGARNARKLLVLGGEIGDGTGRATITSPTPGAKDLDFPSGFTQALSLALAQFGTPKVLAGMTDDAPYASYIGQLHQFADQSLVPFCDDLGHFLTHFLARPWSDDDNKYVIQVEPRIAKDREKEVTSRQFLATGDFVTYNEVRIAEGLKPVEGGDVPKSIYLAKLQQAMQPQQPAGDPMAAMAGGGGGQPPADAAAPAGAPGEDGEQPEGDAAPATGDDPLAALMGDGAPGEGDDEQGTQEATLQAALASLGMGAAPVQKAAVPVNKPGSARSPHRAEGEIWTTAAGKRWTKRNGKIVPAPQQQKRGQGTGGPGASETVPAGPSAPAPAQQSQGFDRDAVHAALLKDKGIKALGMTAQVLEKMHPDAVATLAAQMGIIKPEAAVAKHAEAVPVTPESKPVLERAHEWADSMAQKHAAAVAQKFGIKPQQAQVMLARAIRMVAKHAVENGGKASGTLNVGGRKLNLGVRTGAARTGADGAPKPPATGLSAPSSETQRPTKPPTPQQLGLAGPTGRAEKQSAPKPAPVQRQPEAPDWAAVANSPNRNRGTGLKRPGWWKRLKESGAGRLARRAWGAYEDAVDRGIIAFGNDDDRADARYRRKERKRLKKAVNPWRVLEELRDAGHDELAGDLHALLTAETPQRFQKAWNESEHPRDHGKFAGKDGAKGESPLDAASVSHEEWAASAIEPNAAAQMVARIRGGDERSKNKGEVRPASVHRPLVLASVPISALPERVVEQLRETTSAERVARYAAQKISTPALLSPLRTGDGFGVSDGGHRIMAAIARGDSHFPALVPVGTYELLKQFSTAPVRKAMSSCDGPSGGVLVAPPAFGARKKPKRKPGMRKRLSSATLAALTTSVLKSVGADV